MLMIKGLCLCSFALGSTHETCLTSETDLNLHSRIIIIACVITIDIGLSWLKTSRFCAKKFSSGEFFCQLSVCVCSTNFLRHLFAFLNTLRAISSLLHQQIADHPHSSVRIL